MSSELYDILRASIVCYRHSRDVVPWATNDGRCCILFVFVLFLFLSAGVFVNGELYNMIHCYCGRPYSRTFCLMLPSVS